MTKHQILIASPLCMKQIGEVSCCHGVSIVRGREIWIGEKPQHLFFNKTCSTIIEESIMFPAVESYAPLSQFTINECKRNNCDKEITRFKVKLDALNGINDVLKRSSKTKP